MSELRGWSGVDEWKQIKRWNEFKFDSNLTTLRQLRCVCISTVECYEYFPIGNCNIAIRLLCPSILSEHLEMPEKGLQFCCIKLFFLRAENQLMYLLIIIVNPNEKKIPNRCRYFLVKFHILWASLQVPCSMQCRSPDMYQTELYVT